MPYVKTCMIRRKDGKYYTTDEYEPEHWTTKKDRAHIMTIPKASMMKNFLEKEENLKLELVNYNKAYTA